MLQRAAPSLWIFLSTPSARRATRADLECFSHRQFLSTPSARRATSLDPLHMVLRLISIHALREEGDHITSTVKYTAAQISIHALREEGDIVPAVLAATGMQFLSTPSARRATGRDKAGLGVYSPFLSTPSARRATNGFNTTILHNEPFLSTPSARRATAKTETKSLFSYKLYNILHEFRRALIYNGSKNYPNHAK